MPFAKPSDVQIYYEVSGFGPPVLFIQGVGVIGEGWRMQVDYLRPHFQTLVFDNRGIGRSSPCFGPLTIEAMAADARGVMDAAGWDSAHIVGHSMGGVIAQQLALDCPDRIRSLSLLCTFPRGRDAARITPRVLWATLRTRIGTRRMRRRAFLEMLIPPEDLRQVESERLALQLAPLIGRDLADQPPILLKQLQALARHDCSHRLGGLDGIPTLVVSARHDPIAVPRYGRQLADLIPGALFEEMPDASHGMIVHQPQGINQRLEAFFTQVEKSWTGTQM